MLVRGGNVIGCLLRNMCANLIIFFFFSPRLIRMDHCRNSLGTTKLQNPMNMISLLLVVAQVDLHVLRYDVKMALKNRLYVKLLQKLISLLIMLI